MGEDELGAAILEVALDDPLNKWGARKVQEKMALKGVHARRQVSFAHFNELCLFFNPHSDYISAFRQAENPEAAAARHPITRKVHPHGLWSIGPNEEWGIDGHEKILNSMGIAIYGIIDRFSRMELGLWAVPNARILEVPPLLYLRLVRKLGGIHDFFPPTLLILIILVGMPITTTSDMGSEVSRLIPLVETLR